ncbi:MAG: hypothetical protein IKP49_09550 [Treponema sp.]|nr:hypothetical protein [Treponema sp.]
MCERIHCISRRKIHSGKIIITNAFVKKSQKLKKQDKECAISARADYLERIKEGTYYESD